MSGQSSLVYLGGWTHPQMTIKKSAGLVISLPRAGGGGFGFGGGGGGFGGAGGGNTPEAQRTRERQLDSLKALIADARAYDVAMRAAAADRTLPRVQPDVKLAAMLPYVRGELPVLMPADRAVDIRASLDFAQEQRLTPIIIGAREALAVADRLKQMKVPVVYTHVRALPGREDDAFDVNYSAPGHLAAAGVTLAISTGNDGAEVRDLPHIAGMAAAYGLGREDALRAVTLWPAQIFGMADRFGSLEVGRVANIVVTTGDLLEARTDTKYLFIDGRPVPLETRHTTLNTTHKDRK